MKRGKRGFGVAVLLGLLVFGPVGAATADILPVASINITFLDSAYDPGSGVLAVLDNADVVVEDPSGAQQTFDDGLFSMQVTLQADNSTGGLASGVFSSGVFTVQDEFGAELLGGTVTDLVLDEVADGGGYLAGRGDLVISSGSLELAFGPEGEIFQMTFNVTPAEIDDFTTAFTGVSNISLQPVDSDIPEPATMGLLAAGMVVTLVRRKRR